MSNFDYIGRRPVLAGIGATAVAAFFKPTLVRAQALDRPPSVLVFDVAESLLDLGTLRPLFARVFGDGAKVDEWFGETILYSESATLTNAFAPFGQLGVGVFRMLGRIRNVSISKAHDTVLNMGKGAGPKACGYGTEKRKHGIGGILALFHALIHLSAARWAPLPLRLIVGYGFAEHGFAKLLRGPEKFHGVVARVGDA
jgi:hypothetical protein